jgi:NitT/TauT family transport system permease protein
MGVMLAALSRPELREILVGAGATFLRVELTLVLAGLWTIPVGVYIGLRPRLAAIAQPIAQIAASVPATALFPIVLLFLIRLGGGLGIGSIVLLLLGTQRLSPQISKRSATYSAWVESSAGADCFSRESSRT